MKFLIVVDMQNDFITGSLGSAEAQSIVERVGEKLKKFSGQVIFTRDMHFENYLETEEGRKLPVKHCVKGTKGFEICDTISDYAKVIVDKQTFGSLQLPEVIKSIDSDVEEIELCGLCTDICVISNAMILKAAFPETKISVDASCCAGVTPKSHETAIEAMRAVWIDIKNS